jgi:hypothetical protein
MWPAGLRVDGRSSRPRGQLGRTLRHPAPSWLNRLDRLEPRPAVVRYERERPGELLQLDTKKLGRIGEGGGHRVLGRASKHRHQGIGSNRVHVAVDDHSRLAYVEELADESPATTVAFLQRGAKLLRRPWHQRRARADRQWHGLPEPALRGHPRRAQHRTPLDKGLPAADQRQGRALYPHDARRVGLRASLPRHRGAHGRSAVVAGLLQLPATTLVAIRAAPISRCPSTT